MAVSRCGLATRLGVLVIGDIQPSVDSRQTYGSSRERRIGRCHLGAYHSALKLKRQFARRDFAAELCFQLGKPMG
jgi:hypothetical protein